MKKPFSQLAARWLVLVFWAAALGFAANTAQQKPPIKLGTSGSNVKDINNSFCCTGTLGSLVKDARGNQYILSNNHVLAQCPTVNPSLGLAVEKSGRTTSKTTGKIGSINVTVTVSGYGPCGMGKNTAKFVKQFVINSTTFSGSSDSGSLIVTQPPGTKPKPVGLLFAGSSSTTVGNPINSVLTALGIKFVGSNAEAPMETPTDPELQRVSTVKDRNDDYLLHLPGVVGHGVSLAQDGSGRPVIVLFLKDEHVSVENLPTTVEGVPVETQVTGEFRTTVNCSHVAGK